MSEVKHFDPSCCDVCFMLFYIFSLSQGSYPKKEMKDKLFKLKREHTAKKEMIKFE